MTPEAVIDLTSIPGQATTRDQQFLHDVAIVGLGYVGLPTALAFIHAGRSVMGLDASVFRLEAVRAGRVDLVNSDHERLSNAMAGQTLGLSHSPEVVATAGTVIICVPTPVDSHLVPDLRALRGACASVVEHAVTGQVIILTSTTYVGTTRELLVGPLEARGFRMGQDICVAFSPERIDPGNTEVAQENVPRVVGGVTPHCGARAAEVISAYANKVHVVSSLETAELTKLYENSFRAVNIALVNELADISRELEVEVMEVIEAAKTKPYGFMAFTPGSGVGGHCIPCDPHYLLWQMRSNRHSAPLLEQAMASIAGRPRHVVERAQEVLGTQSKSLHGSSVLVVGVSYKPSVADCRESPALEIIERLMTAGADVSYTDDLVPELKLRTGQVLTSTGAPAISQSVDLVILNTVHPGFDHTWVTAHPLILDATYRFETAPHRATL